MPSLDNAADDEIAVLRLVNGEGCAKLLRADPARGAMLLERLGRPMSAPEPADRAAARTAVRGRRADLAPGARQRLPGARLRTGAETGRRLADYITTTWEQLDRPCTEQAVDYALACAARRTAAHDDERAVLLHGDLHQWNALEAGDGTFKLVDPDGVLAEPEYELSVIMREDPVELMTGDPRDRARWLARRCGLDATGSGSGASSSESRPAWSAPRSTSSRSAVRCSPPPTTSPPITPQTSQLGFDAAIKIPPEPGRMRAMSIDPKTTASRTAGLAGLNLQSRDHHRGPARLHRLARHRGEVVAERLLANSHAGDAAELLQGVRGRDRDVTRRSTFAAGSTDQLARPGSLQGRGATATLFVQTHHAWG